MIPCIILAGKTGAGKTSLAQAILGKEIVSNDRIGHSRPKTMKFNLYTDNRIRIWDWRGYEPGKPMQIYRYELYQFVKSTMKKVPESRWPDMIWYCIDGSGARVCQADITLLKETSKFTTIPVITKIDITRKSSLNAIVNSLKKARINTSKIAMVSSVTGCGLDKLRNMSRRLLPEARKKARELKNECYIASRLYGSDFHPVVMHMRGFRENCLKRTTPGKLLSVMYSKLGPYVAEIIGYNVCLKSILNKIVQCDLGRSRDTY